MDRRSWPEKGVYIFKVTYDGETLESHEIDAKILAKSLSGISSVLNVSNKIVNGPFSKIDVKVRGSFAPGSFAVDIITFATSSSFQAIANVAGILGFAGFLANSLIQLYRSTKGEKINKIERIDPENVKVTTVNGSVIITNHYTVRIYQNQDVRDGMAEVISPLFEQGVSEICFSSDEYPTEIITEDEKEIFSPPDPEDLEEITDIAELTVTQSNLNGNATGWRFSFNSSGKDDFWADVLDETFLRDVHSRKYSFTNGTKIVAEYQRKKHKKKRTVSDWNILKVYEVKSAD